MKKVSIVSLSAWATRTLLDMELGRWITGLSYDIPKETELKDLPVVTRPVGENYRDAELSSRDKLTLTEIILSPYNVDMELLRSLNPSHIITEGMYYLSGLAGQDMEKILETDGLPECQILDLFPLRMNDIFDDILKIGEVFGYEQNAETLVIECRKKMKKTFKRYVIKRKSPVVAVLRRWIPLQLAGRWLSDLIMMCGGTPLIEGNDLFVSPETYFEKVPDMLLFSHPQLSLSENRERLKALDQSKIMSVFGCECPASQFILDGHALYDRSCDGLVQSIQVISEILKKDLKHKKLEGTFWDNIKQ